MTENPSGLARWRVSSRSDFSIEIPDDQFDDRTQLTWGERNRLWRGMLKGYFDTEDEEFLKRVEKQVLGRTAARNAIMIVHNYKNSDIFEMFKQTMINKINFALETYEKLDEPIFF